MDSETKEGWFSYVLPSGEWDRIYWQLSPSSLRFFYEDAHVKDGKSIISLERKQGFFEVQLCPDQQYGREGVFILSWGGHQDKTNNGNDRHGYFVLCATPEEMDDFLDELCCVDDFGKRLITKDVCKIEDKRNDKLVPVEPNALKTGHIQHPALGQKKHMDWDSLAMKEAADGLGLLVFSGICYYGNDESKTPFQYRYTMFRDWAIELYPDKQHTLEREMLNLIHVVGCNIFNMGTYTFTGKDKFQVNTQYPTPPSATSSDIVKRLPTYCDVGTNFTIFHLQPTQGKRINHYFVVSTLQPGQLIRWQRAFADCIRFIPTPPQSPRIAPELERVTTMELNRSEEIMHTIHSQTRKDFLDDRLMDEINYIIATENYIRAKQQIDIFRMDNGYTAMSANADGAYSETPRASAHQRQSTFTLGNKFSGRALSGGANAGPEDDSIPPPPPPPDYLMAFIPEADEDDVPPPPPPQETDDDSGDEMIQVVPLPRAPLHVGVPQPQTPGAGAGANGAAGTATTPHYNNISNSQFNDYEGSLSHSENSSATPGTTTASNMLQPDWTHASTTETTKGGNMIKSAVSKKKRRFKLGSFDLDLTYITDRIIAMGFPSVGAEAVYRNDIRDVTRFFENRHPNHYKIYNLCSERLYPKSSFPRVLHFPFDDHNPPVFQDLIFIVRDLTRWLRAHPDNIAGIHCKAGKGRTGLVICILMMYIGMFMDVRNSLRYYASVRTQNAKGVTIPSQLRYVYMFQTYMVMAQKKAQQEQAKLGAKVLVNPMTNLPDPTGRHEIPADVGNNTELRTLHEQLQKSEDSLAQARLNIEQIREQQKLVHEELPTRLPAARYLQIKSITVRGENVPPFDYFTVFCRGKNHTSKDLKPKITTQKGQAVPKGASTPNNNEDDAEEIKNREYYKTLTPEQQEQEIFFQKSKNLYKNKTYPGDGHADFLKTFPGPITTYTFADGQLPVFADFYVEFHKTSLLGKKRVFSFWLHTQFVEMGGMKVIMNKEHLDKANKAGGKDFQCEIQLESLPEHLIPKPPATQIVTAPSKH